MGPILTVSVSLNRGGPRLTTVGALLATLCGCSAAVSTFEIVDHPNTANTRRYRETFNESYYDLDDCGNLNLVLRRSRSAEQADQSDITQVIHIRSVWRSIPGSTVADEDQINAMVRYSIVGDGAGGTLEGAGSVFYTPNRRNNAITGTLERAMLYPGRELGTGEPLFLRARLSGRFTAAHNPRQVIRIMNEVERLFGPPSAPARAMPSGPNGKASR